MDYASKLAENGSSADINYSCPCGCTAGLVYVRDAGASDAGECCCGRILWVGASAEAEVRRREEPGVVYEIDLNIVTLPWGEVVTAALAVPASVLAEEGSSHDRAHGNGPSSEDATGTARPHGTVVDGVCGMTIDPATAAGTSQYQGTTYYFCAIACKAKFDAEPSRYVKTSLLSSLKRRLFHG